MKNLMVLDWLTHARWAARRAMQRPARSPADAKAEGNVSNPLPMMVFDKLKTDDMKDDFRSDDSAADDEDRRDDRWMEEESKPI